MKLLSFKIVLHAWFLSFVLTQIGRCFCVRMRLSICEKNFRCFGVATLFYLNCHAVFVTIDVGFKACNDYGIFLDIERPSVWREDALSMYVMDDELQKVFSFVDFGEVAPEISVARRSSLSAHVSIEIASFAISSLDGLDASASVVEECFQAFSDDSSRDCRFIRCLHF